MLLFSSSLGLFNISYDAYQNIILAFLHTSQIVLSAVLILLSIAQYIGTDNTLSKEEEIFYRYATLLEHEKYKENLENKYSKDMNSLLKDE
ncbi:hypothetical protein [Lysinibacillus sp. GbtcB16]|uniref:hypothetical protein n=1 Tax=Lysinibacillus sp. GbtcB16 TaxID=2824761 RepID=UPI001C2F56BC|nr:hypothetical protein [Lysinibacillus sp. GbtcB16]